MKIKESIKPLRPYQPGKGIEEVKKEHQLHYIVKLASNENVYGPSPLVKEKVNDGPIDFEIYPDGYAEKLRLKLADSLHINPDTLVFGSGSEEIIQMICRTYLEPGTNTVMATPTFPQYKHYATVENAEVREVPLLNGKHNLEKMRKQIDTQTRVVWLCTPNNPTGCYISKEELRTFLKQVSKDVLIVIDEAYYEFVFADDFPEAIPLIDAYENVLVLRTFSKAYGLAGLRVGYGVGSKDVITNLNKIRGPFNVTSIGQMAAYFALEDQRYIDRIKAKNVEVRSSLEHFCNQHGLLFDKSETNFLLIHLPTSGITVSEKLLTYGFIVRPGELLGVPNSIRVTIGKKEDMDAFKVALLECI
ncbi:histidinol-phosphate transaminase [Salirhabdus sp. Marseille-P4669]|uniref:histidinol-phosphate transaminase n=1 Tax=Salirhabdus sp. Marseille-P4669 TaxID=2042310 RepID=UPI000C7A9D3A|nr:histidinol-phosphate transaminase [Salirhabdus sp. Marseille-P4669]